METPLLVLVLTAVGVPCLFLGIGIAGLLQRLRTNRRAWHSIRMPRNPLPIVKL
jgi:hypothetical protein